MSVNTSLNKYRELLMRKAEARKMEIDIDVEIQVLEKQMEISALLAAGGVVAASSESADFIEQYRDQLEPDDIEFLSQEYRGTGEVVDQTGMSVSAIKRKAKSGEFDSRKDESGRHRYKTVSVMRCMVTKK